jgi:hypothetical protein
LSKKIALALLVALLALGASIAQATTTVETSRAEKDTLTITSSHETGLDRYKILYGSSNAIQSQESKAIDPGVESSKVNRSITTVTLAKKSEVTRQAPDLVIGTNNNEVLDEIRTHSGHIGKRIVEMASISSIWNMQSKKFSPAMTSFG